jgi:threonine/homoserine efflux transporter RhtA
VKFTTEIGTDAATWRAHERVRMAGVSKQFTTLKIVEVVLAVGGLVTAGIARGTDHPMLEGIGYGIAIDAAATFAFDVWAARRAHRYRAALAADRVVIGISF